MTATAPTLLGGSRLPRSSRMAIRVLPGRPTLPGFRRFGGRGSQAMNAVSDEP